MRDWCPVPRDVRQAVYLARNASDSTDGAREQVKKQACSAPKTLRRTSFQLRDVGLLDPRRAELAQIAPWTALASAAPLMPPAECSGDGVDDDLKSFRASDLFAGKVLE